MDYIRLLLYNQNYKRSDMSGIYSIILAGGQGSRLWPLSREMSPKQIFKINDKYSFFQKTFLRLASVVDDKNIITAANVKNVSDIKEQLKVIQEKFARKREYKIISEPLSKNTAPSLALSVKYIQDNYSQYSSSVIIVVPSDLLFFSREEFADNVSKGIQLAKQGYIVSFVSETNYIDENYGYVKIRKNAKISEIEQDAYKVSEFIEKPTAKDKKEKLKGKYYLNSGIYMFSAETFFEELKKYAPDIYNIVNINKVTDNIPSFPMMEYDRMPNISVDYSIMEKTKKLAAVKLNTSWTDIGSWESVFDILEKDSSDNAIVGSVVKADTENSMIYSTSKLIAALGIKNTFIIETEDALLVCDKDNLNGIKNIYKKLNSKNAKTKEVHKTAYRPWGYYTVLEEGKGFLTKCITVNPDSKLSLQLHHHRSEHWIVLEGEATVIRGEDTYKLMPGESIDIDIEQIHSLQNYSDKQLKIIEIQQGDILDENDIERLEDIYGRV